MTSVLNVTSPRTESLNVTSVDDGTLKRITGRSPTSMRARAASSDSSRQPP